MAGGAYNGIYTIGALKHLIEKEFFDINNIESIYGTSVGGLTAPEDFQVAAQSQCWDASACVRAGRST